MFLVHIRVPVCVALCCPCGVPVLRIDRDIVNLSPSCPARACPCGDVFVSHLFFPYFLGHIVLALVFLPSIFFLFSVSSMLSLASCWFSGIFSLCVTFPSSVLLWCRFLLCRVWGFLCGAFPFFFASSYLPICISAPCDHASFAFLVHDFLDFSAFL